MWVKRVNLRASAVHEQLERGLIAVQQPADLICKSLGLWEETRGHRGNRLGLEKRRTPHGKVAVYLEILLADSRQRPGDRVPLCGSV